MSDEKILADPPDIGFDTSTARMKRIKQRYSPPIVVVGMTSKSVDVASE